MLTNIPTGLCAETWLVCFVMFWVCNLVKWRKTANTDIFGHCNLNSILACSSLSTINFSDSRADSTLVKGVLSLAQDAAFSQFFNLRWRNLSKANITTKSSVQKKMLLSCALGMGRKAKACILKLLHFPSNVGSLIVKTIPLKFSAVGSKITLLNTTRWCMGALMACGSLQKFRNLVGLPYLQTNLTGASRRTLIWTHDTASPICDASLAFLRLLSWRQND